MNAPNVSYAPGEDLSHPGSILDVLEAVGGICGGMLLVFALYGLVEAYGPDRVRILVVGTVGVIGGALVVFGFFSDSSSAGSIRNEAEKEIRTQLDVEILEGVPRGWDEGPVTLEVADGAQVRECLLRPERIEQARIGLTLSCNTQEGQYEVLPRA